MIIEEDIISTSSLQSYKEYVLFKKDIPSSTKQFKLLSNLSIINFRNKLSLLDIINESEIIFLEDSCGTYEKQHCLSFTISSKGSIHSMSESTNIPPSRYNIK